MDTLSKARRSWNMSRIKAKHTRPEVIVRSMLHRMGLRFRLHSTELPGTPDIVLPRWKTVVFVDGCFWHRHKDCRFAYTPKSRVDFWQHKFQDNVRRDTKRIGNLHRLGWRVIVVWECETQNVKKLAARLQRLFKLNPMKGRSKHTAQYPK